MGQTRDEEPAKTTTAPAPKPAHGGKPVDKRKAATKRFEADQAKEKQASAMKTTLYVVADILKEQRATLIAGAPEGAKIGLTELHVAATSKRKNAPIDGAARRTAFDTAMLLVEPKIGQYRKELEDPEWLAEHITERLARLRNEVMLTEAAHRTSNAVRIGGNHIYEDTDNARTTGHALHAELPRAVATIKIVSEQMVRIGHHELDHEAKAMLEAKLHGHTDKIGSFADLLGAFSFAEGLLMLSDEQFIEHVKHARGPYRVTTYAELVKAVVETLGGAISVTAYVTSKIAKLGGNTQLATTMLGVSRLASLKVSTAITYVEMIYGAAIMLSPDSTWGQRLNGAVTVGTNAAIVFAQKTANKALGQAVGTGAIAVTAGWELFKWAVETFYGASLGITKGVLEVPMTRLANHGGVIARLMEEIINSKLLVAKETDPERQRALQKVHDLRLQQLRQRVDDLASDTSATNDVSQMAKHAGSYKLLNGAFIALQPFKGATKEEVIMTGAAIGLERIQFILMHVPEIQVATAEGKGWSETKTELEKKDSRKGH